MWPAAAHVQSPYLLLRYIGHDRTFLPQFTASGGAGSLDVKYAPKRNVRLSNTAGFLPRQYCARSMTKLPDYRLVVFFRAGDLFVGFLFVEPLLMAVSITAQLAIALAAVVKAPYFM